MKKLIAVLLCAAVLITAFVMASGVPASAVNATVTYAFTGANANDPGFAQGNITVSAGAGKGGTYDLYWADSSGVLSGSKAIGSVNVASAASAVFVMPAYTAIPAGATKVAAFKGSAGALSNAAVYDIPQNKLIGHTPDDALYTFAAFSDFHIASNEYDVGYSKYPYDEQHEADAWKMASLRKADFVVTTGDHINNQRHDSQGGNNDLYAEEWNTYLRVLADSDYTGPVYEAIGNHELWNYDTESQYRGRDWKTGSDCFVQVSGLSGKVEDYNSGKAYFEVTEPVTGDHFLFMSLEGGFYTDRVDEFTDAQLTWLENKLKAYQNDGKNTFIMEHANFEKWGAGDRTDVPVYDIPLKDTKQATAKLKALLQTYKNAVVITGHTHFKFSLQHNYSNNNNTSSLIIHNSSVGGIRDMNPNKVGPDARINDKSREGTEGYFIEVYDNATIFYGVDLYKNEVIPTATYIVAQTTSALNPPETEAPSSEAESTAAESTAAPSTAAPSTEESSAAESTGAASTGESSTAAESTEAASSEEPSSTAALVVWGDVDGDGVLGILDATAIQQELAHLVTLTDDQIAIGKVSGEATLSILDATYIQQKLAHLIERLPIEEKLASTGARQDIGNDGYEIVAVAAAAEAEPAGSDLSTLRMQAQTALTKYYLLASYPQYAALKKAYKENAGYDDLSAAYTEFNQAVRDFYPGDNIDVYFENDKSWSVVKAYCYAPGGVNNGNWPGQTCSKVGARNGKDVYKISVPLGKYSYIIFTDGSSQTVNLALGITKNQGYYIDGEYSGKYLAKQFVYGK